MMNGNNLRFILPAAVFVLLMLTVGCNKEPNLPVKEATEIRDVAYGSHERQKMDILLPKNYNASSPVVFLIHGGGFVLGSKKDFETQAQLFRDENFVVVNLSYRLIDTTGLTANPPLRRPSEVMIKHQVEDVHNAVNAYMQKAAELGTSTDKLYMAGHSAGATLALLYVQGPRNKDGLLRASANWAGAVDLTVQENSTPEQYPPSWRELMHRATGAELKKENNLYYMAVSPYWVTYNDGARPNISILPEFNSIFGDPGETEYTLYTYQIYHQLLRQKGVREKFTLFEGEDHGFGTKPDSWRKLIKETADFFRAN